MKRFLINSDPRAPSNSSTSRVDAVTVSTSGKRHKTQPNRKYDRNYLKFGFIVKPDTEGDYPIPQCVLCKETLSNQCMKPSLLKRHQQTRHSGTENQPIEFFERKADNFKKESQCMEVYRTQDKRLLKASYEGSLRIVKDGKAHTTGETFLLPAVKDMVQTVLGEKAAKEIAKIPLSNNTVKRRIVDMSIHIESTLISRLQKCTYFALQIDESTDVTNMAQLISFVRYDYLDEIKEDFFFCEPLKSNTGAENIFNLIDDYLSKNGISWKKCVGICTDGAQAMFGKLTGLAARIGRVAPDCKSTHCAIHREALASKNMPQSLSKVLQEAVKVSLFVCVF